MKLETNNMLFDDALPDCKIILSSTGTQVFAFVQALDIGMKHARLKKPHKVRYWGPWSHGAPKESMQYILTQGGKWPSLPN